MVSVGEGRSIGGDIAMKSDRSDFFAGHHQTGGEARDQIALRAVSFPGLTAFSCRGTYS